jgi:hypothetical protein
MSVQTLAVEIDVDPGDVEVIARWLTVDEALDDDVLDRRVTRAGYRAHMPGPSDDWTADLAAEHIRATLGVEPEPHDICGRMGAYDLRYEQDGQTVAVEVKAVLDQRLRTMDEAITRAEYIPAAQLTRRWVVYLRVGTDIRRARAGLPGLLAECESRGWDIVPPVPHIRGSALAEQLDRLHVVSAHGQAATSANPGGFAMLPEQVWTWEQETPGLAAFVSGVLNDENSVPIQTLRRQLGDAENVDERHAFLFVGWEHPSIWPLMSAGGELPTEQPQLPDPIDGVWVATFSTETRVVAWLPGRGWIEGQRSNP